jgi:uncharacterized protein (DUF2236 family)
MVPDVRTWLGQQIRERVIGSDAETRHAEVFASDEPGWFDEQAPIRRVHADAAMFIGGLRALMLQTMHPLAMAGVADHSDYRRDPWGRLQRTADYVATTTFGPASQAQRAVDRVHRVHRRVVGVAPDGRPYAANDPHLLEWVHIAEIDSFLAAYDRHGSGSLVGAERDRYVADTAVVARALGIADPPESEAALRARIDAYRPELQATPQAREATRWILLRPPIPLAARPAYGALAAAAVALMPTWTRLPLRLPWLPVTEHVAIRLIGDLATTTIRWATPQPA